MSRDKEKDFGREAADVCGVHLSEDVIVCGTTRSPPIRELSDGLLALES